MWLASAGSMQTRKLESAKRARWYSFCFQIFFLFYLETTPVFTHFIVTITWRDILCFKCCQATAANCFLVVFFFYLGYGTILWVSKLRVQNKCDNMQRLDTGLDDEKFTIC